MINSNSFIDLDFYNKMAGESIVAPANENESPSEEYFKLELNTNSSIIIMEQIANRILKSRDYSYLSTSDDYEPEYSIFDGIRENSLFLPTYPINSISKLLISGEEISQANPLTEYDSTTKFFVYSKLGKINYLGGFDYGLKQNIQIAWNGGYSINNYEYGELQKLQFLLTKFFMDDGELDSQFLSESLGNYKYTRMSPAELASTYHIPPFIYRGIYRFRKHTIG